MIFPIIIVFITQWFGIQGSVRVISEDIICPVYSEEYFTEPEVYQIDEITVFFNLTIIKVLPIETQYHTVLMAASMGEYVVHTGIEIQMDLCDIFEEPIVTAGLLDEFGFSADHCPPDIGVYGTEGHVAPTDRLPDDVPPNQYLLTTTLSYEVYVPPVRICYKYGRLGHISGKCVNKEVCLQCSQVHVRTAEEKCINTERCVNCEGIHSA